MESKSIDFFRRGREKDLFEARDWNSPPVGNGKTSPQQATFFSRTHWLWFHSTFLVDFIRHSLLISFDTPRILSWFLNVFKRKKVDDLNLKKIKIQNEGDTSRFFLVSDFFQIQNMYFFTLKTFKNYLKSRSIEWNQQGVSNEIRIDVVWKKRYLLADFFTIFPASGVFSHLTSKVRLDTYLWKKFLWISGLLLEILFLSEESTQEMVLLPRKDVDHALRTTCWGSFQNLRVFSLFCQSWLKGSAKRFNLHSERLRIIRSQVEDLNLSFSFGKERGGVNNFRMTLLWRRTAVTVEHCRRPTVFVPNRWPVCRLPTECRMF